MPQLLLDQIPGANHIGAPDFTYYHGQYLLFYQSHIPDTCNAATGLAINQSLDPECPNYQWVDHGLVLRSKASIDGLDVFCGGSNWDYNEIEAHFLRMLTARPGWPLYFEGGSPIIDKDGPLVGTGHNNVFSGNGVDLLVHHAKHSE